MEFIPTHRGRVICHRSRLGDLLQGADAVLWEEMDVGLMSIHILRSPKTVVFSNVKHSPNTIRLCLPKIQFFL